MLTIEASPILVNVASFRNIIGFAFTFGVTDWVQQAAPVYVEVWQVAAEEDEPVGLKG